MRARFPLPGKYHFRFRMRWEAALARGWPGLGEVWAGGGELGAPVLSRLSAESGFRATGPHPPVVGGYRLGWPPGHLGPAGRFDWPAGRPAHDFKPSDMQQLLRTRNR